MTTCSKIPYPTLGKALTVAKALARAQRTRGLPRYVCGVHSCAVCHAWHATSQQVKEKWRVSPS